MFQIIRSLDTYDWVAVAAAVLGLAGVLIAVLEKQP